jgi:hypothetical protein
VARLARLTLPAGAPDFEIVERLIGNATTDFGAPGIPAKVETRPLSAQESERMRSLVAACWEYLDGVRAKAPAELRKGPRGGGRDRDKMFEHVLGAEFEYAKGIGLRLKQPAGTDGPAIRAQRQAILGRLAEPILEAKWPAAYAARRIAWHALDHAWEMEDRSH